MVEGTVAAMGVEAEEWWWWGAASSAQLAAGIASVRRGLGGSSASMPFKAFVVASLFVGGGTTSAVALLQANGIRELDDWKQLGAGIRRQLGAPPGRRGPAGDVEEVTATSLDG